MDLLTVVNVLGWTALTYVWFEANIIFLESCFDAFIRNVRNQALVEHYHEKARRKQELKEKEEEDWEEENWEEE